MKPEENLDKLLAKYGIALDSRCAERFRRYHALLKKWNQRINLTSSTSWRVLGPLFEEAVWAAGLYSSHATHHLDIGSGAGFPAVPMRILIPGMQVRMLESRANRAIFLEQVIDDLQLKGCSVKCLRILEFLAQNPEPWDCVSWKGLKLARKELESLVDSSREGVQFWLFHGRKLPVEDPEMLDRQLRLSSKVGFEKRKEWHLSIYTKATRSPVSRETERGQDPSIVDFC